MSHRPELLSAMLDGELNEEEAAWLADHLDGCGSCRAELDGLSRARGAVRSLPLLDLPDGAFPVEVGRRPRDLRRRVAAGALAAAAAAVIAIGALGMLGMSTDAQTPVDLAAAETILAATATLDPRAADSEVGSYLTSGRHSHFRARQTTACIDDGSLRDRTVALTQAGNVTIVADPLAHMTVLTAGTVSSEQADGSIATTTIAGAAPRVAPDYTVSSVRSDVSRERPTQIVTLSRDQVERARLWIDTETGVIVHRELLSSTGEVACVSELADFEPADGRIQASIPFDPASEETSRTFEPSPAEMPDRLGDLELVTVYALDEGVLGVYGDGLFLLGVLRLDGGDPTPVDSQSPAVVWESGGETWGVVGAVPDDVKEAAIRELPPADNPHPVVDGWRHLFG